jgi:Xaa-Pro dipeptidase
MITSQLFAQHIATISDYTTQALAHSASKGANYDGIVFHAGTQFEYHADDHHINFHTIPHFARFAPVQGADHLLVFKPNTKPRLIHVIPQDFWFESPPMLDHPYPEVLDVTIVSTAEEAIREAGNVWRFAYIGNDAAVADALGLPKSAIEPQALMSALDWFRAYKTEYEVACIQAATHIAAKGYAVVKQLVQEAKTERELHAAYLAATDQTDLVLPYGNIIGWDEASATLHYTAKRTTKPNPAHTLLIDAGATTFGYACDFTRTYTHGTPHPVFANLQNGLDQLCMDCSDACLPHHSYADIHVAAHKRIADMLSEVGVFTISGAEAFEKGLSRTFFPHGLGHHLGLQVHDVGGKQMDIDGTIAAPDAQYAWLRTTRPMEAGHVLTIEPGLYFIPLLLTPQRTGEHKSCFNWALVDELLPLGGIRAEDNIVVTNDKPLNLSREFIGDHR